MQGEDKNVASYHFRVAVKGHSIFLETHPSPVQAPDNKNFLGVSYQGNNWSHLNHLNQVSFGRLSTSRVHLGL